MASEVGIKRTGAIAVPIIFANIATHSPSALNNLGTATTQLNLTSIAAGAARQSDKVSLSVGTIRAETYGVTAAIEFASAPAGTGTVDFYWAPSPSATAGTGNPGNVTGVDGAYSGYSSNLASSLGHLLFIVSMPVTVQGATTVQVAAIGEFVPTEQWGSLIVVNNTSVAFVANAVQMSVLFTPHLGDVSEV
jgi:hypothetical protein